MRLIFIFFNLLLFSNLNCQDLISIANVSKKVFSDIDSSLYLMDGLLNEDGTVTIVGSKLKGIDKKPFILKVGNNRQLEYFNFLAIDSWHPIQKKIKIKIQPTLDQKYMLYTVANLESTKGLFNHLTKVNEVGESIWDKTFQDEGKYFRALDISTLPNGDFLMYSDADKGFLTSFSAQIDRVDSTGRLIYTKPLDFVPNSVIHNVKKGEIHMLCKKYGSSFRGLKIQKINYIADNLNEKIIEARKGYEIEEGILTLADNGDYIVMYSEYDLKNPISNQDIIIKKFDKDGMELWSEKYEKYYIDQPIDILQTQDKGYIYLLSSKKRFKSTRICVGKINEDGEVLWEHFFYRGKKSEKGIKLIEKKNGNIVVFGNSAERVNKEIIYHPIFFELNSKGDLE